MSDDLVKQAKMVVETLIPEWEQIKQNEWRWTVAGSVGVLAHDLDDGTWSYRINNVGRCGYPTKVEAQVSAEEAMRCHLSKAISDFEDAHSKLRAITEMKGAQDD